MMEVTLTTYQWLSVIAFLILNLGSVGFFIWRQNSRISVIEYRVNNCNEEFKEFKENTSSSVVKNYSEIEKTQDSLTKFMERTMMETKDDLREDLNKRLDAHQELVKVMLTNNTEEHAKFLQSIAKITEVLNDVAADLKAHKAVHEAIDNKKNY